MSRVSAKPGEAAPASANCAALAMAASSASRSASGDQGTRPADAQGQVLVPAGEVDVAQRGAARRILDDDDTPALPVAAARGEARRVEQAFEHVVADRLGVEPACRAGAAQRGDEVEVHEWRSVVAGG